MNKLAYLSILVLLAVITHRAWFFNFSILTYGDWQFFFNETQKEFLNLPFVWQSASLGQVNLGLWMYPINILWGLLAHFTNFAISERFLYFYPSLILATISSFFLVRKITKSDLAGFIGSLVFTYNTYFCSIRSGHFTLLTAFAIAPFMILLFMQTLEKKCFSLAILTGLIGFTIGFYETRAFYITSFILTLYFVYYIFFQKNQSLKEILNTSLFALAPMIIVVFLNSYWFLPFVQENSFLSNGLLNRGLFGNEFMNLPRALTLFHPFWGSPRGVFFTVQPTPLYFWAIPFFAFLGLLLNKRNKQVLFFGTISLVGILLTKQSAAPFSGLYLWLYNNLPGFNAFREASKFYFLIVCGYSVLIGALVAWFWKNYRKIWLQKFVTYSLIFLVAIIFLWNAKTTITGEAGALFVPRHIPNDYLILKNFILEQNKYFRTLWVPVKSRWSFVTNQNPALDAIYLKNEWKTMVNSKTNPSVGEEIINTLKGDFSGTLLDRLAIKYVIVPLQDKGNEDDFFVYYNEKRTFYINELDKLDYLTKINLNFKNMVIYENEDYMPHIYLTHKPQVNFEGLGYQIVDFERNNPTQYKIFLKNISEPIYLNFAESYHPSWKLRVEEFHWWQTFINKDYFLPDENHFPTDTSLNYFRIDPDQIKSLAPQHKSYLENLDGSIDFDLTLYFQPQSDAYLMLIVYGSCVGVGLLLFLIKRKVIKIFL